MAWNFFALVEECDLYVGDIAQVPHTIGCYGLFAEDGDPNEEESDRLYSIFNDGTLVTMAGVPQVHFHRAAPSLEEAIGSALAHVRKAGFDAVRVEIEPQNRARLRSNNPKLRKGKKHG